MNISQWGGVNRSQPAEVSTTPVLYVRDDPCVDQRNLALVTEDSFESIYYT